MKKEPEWGAKDGITKTQRLTGEMEKTPRGLFSVTRDAFVGLKETSSRVLPSVHSLRGRKTGPAAKTKGTAFQPLLAAAGTAASATTTTPTSTRSRNAVHPNGVACTNCRPEIVGVGVRAPASSRRRRANEPEKMPVLLLAAVVMVVVGVCGHGSDYAVETRSWPTAGALQQSTEHARLATHSRMDSERK